MRKVRGACKLGMACLLILVSLAATWFLRRGTSADLVDRAGADSRASSNPTAQMAVPDGAAEQPKPTRQAAAARTDLPRLSGGSASDRAIARWAERVRQNSADISAWTELGDALMQKARETMDAGYYAHAERAFNKAL